MHLFRRVCTVCIFFLGVGLGAAVAQPGRGPASSVYTALDLRRCAPLESPDGGETDMWRCPGYLGIALIVLRRNGQFDLDAGEDNGVFESTAGPNALPTRVEWRLRGGRARAIVYRLRLTEGVDAGRPILGVETISRAGVWAGCLVAWIDGHIARAQAVARDLAIGDYQRFQCGHNEPQEITQQSPR